MVEYDNLCLRLFSVVAPCPRMHLEPVLEYLRNMVLHYPHRVDTEDGISGAWEICRVCEFKEPVSKYMRCTENRASMHWKLSEDKVDPVLLTLIGPRWRER